MILKSTFITMSSAQYLQFKIFNFGGSVFVFVFFSKLGENKINKTHALASSKWYFKDEKTSIEYPAKAQFS